MADDSPEMGGGLAGIESDLPRLEVDTVILRGSGFPVGDPPGGEEADEGAFDDS